MKPEWDAVLVLRSEGGVRVIPVRLDYADVESVDALAPDGDARIAVEGYSTQARDFAGLEPALERVEWALRAMLGPARTESTQQPRIRLHGSRTMGSGS